MNKAYLHDVPINLFLKYYLNNKNILSTNERYTPVYTETFYDHYTNYMYRHTYTRDGVTYYKFYKLNKLLTDYNIAKLSYELINTFFYNKIGKTDAIDLIFFDANNNVVKFTDYCDLFGNVLPEKETDFNNLFNENNGYINLTNDISSNYVYTYNFNNYFTNFFDMTAYEYYAEVENMCIPNISYDEISTNTYAYISNLSETDEFIYDESTGYQYDNLIFKKYTPFNNLIIKNDKEYFDPKYRLKYYLILKNNKEIGRLYKLIKFYTLKTDDTGLFIFKDTYLNKELSFPKNKLPLPPALRYHLYMQEYKKKLFSNQINDTGYDDTYTKSTDANKLIFKDFENYSTISFATKYDIITDINTTIVNKSHTTIPPSDIPNSSTSGSISFTPPISSNINISNKYFMQITKLYDSKINPNLNFTDYSESSTSIFVVNSSSSNTTETESYLNENIFTIFNSLDINKINDNEGYEFIINNLPEIKIIDGNVGRIADYTNTIVVNEVDSENLLSYLKEAKVNIPLIQQNNFYPESKYEEYKNLYNSRRFDISYNNKLYSIFPITSSENNNKTTNTIKIIPFVSCLQSYIYLFSTLVPNKYITNTTTDKLITNLPNGVVKISTVTKITNKEDFNIISEYPTLTSDLESLKDFRLKFNSTIFNSSSLYRASELRLSSGVSDTYLSDLYKKSFINNIENLFSTTNKQIFSGNNITSVHDIYLYVNGLFSSLSKLVPNTILLNTGATIYDNDIKYNGFYTKDQISYTNTINLNKNISDSNSILLNNISLSEDEIDELNKEIQAKNVLDKIMNYETFELNVKELKYKINEKINEKRNKLLVESENYGTKDILDENNKNYTENFNDIKLMINHFSSFMTEYLFLNNGISEYFRNFYRNDYLLTIKDKINDPYNKDIITSSNNSNIKISYQNEPDLDKNIFYNALKLKFVES